MALIVNLIFIFLMVGCSHFIKAPGAPLEKKEVFLFTPTAPNENAFLDQAEKYNLTDIKSSKNYVHDLNNDGKLDLVTLDGNFDIPQFYFFNKTEQIFEVASLPVMETVLRASFLAFADLDNDGILDLVAATLNQQTEISKGGVRVFKGKIKNHQYHLTEIKSPLGSESNRYLPIASISLMDFDLDGKLDLYIGNWFDMINQKYVPHPDYLYKGNGFTFENVSALLHEEDAYNKSQNYYYNATPTFGVSACDFNLDGRPDFITASNSGYANKLWLNTQVNVELQKKYGAFQYFFKDVGVDSGFAGDNVGRIQYREGGNSFFSLCADYNQDGFMDVVQGALWHSYDNETKDRASILTGKNSTLPLSFIRTEFFYEEETTREHHGLRRGIWNDLNGDSLLDLLIEDSGFPPYSRLVYLEQAADHSFESAQKENGLDLINPTGLVTADFNLDGKLDILVSQSNIRDAQIPKSIYLFENQKTMLGRPLIIYLRGKKSNRQGIGAMIEVATDKRQQKYFVQAVHGGLPSQSPEGTWFYVANGESLDHIVVTWPIIENGAILRQTYYPKLSKIGQYQEMTLCEGGSWFQGKRVCY
jgi:hypothetical protein